MKYNAFISYRHADPDDFIAGLIHKKLETFKVPRRITKATGIKKIERIFRDQEELPIDASLSDNIDAALNESEFLIVICSPRLLESRWCRAEIENFIRIRDREHVLAVLVEGEPEEAFPDLIRFDEEGKPVEPLAADVRGATKTEMKRKLNSEMMRLAAPLLHCGYDDLKQRHRERRIRRIMTVMAAVMALMVGFAGYYAYTAAQITKNFRDKQVNQSKYLADTALDQLEAGDRMTAIQVALEALPSEENDRPYVAKAEYALNRSLYSYAVGGDLLPDRSFHHSQPVSEFEMSREGNFVVTVDQGETVTVFDTNTGEKKLEVKAPIIDNASVSDVQDARFIDEEAVLIVYEDEAQCYDLEGQLKYTFEGTDSYLRKCVYHSDSKILALISSKEIFILDPNSGEVKASATPDLGEGSFSDDPAFSQDGSRLAVPVYASIMDESVIGHVFVMDTQSGNGEIYETAKTYVEKVCFDDNDHLVVASDGYDESHILQGDGIIELLDLKAHTPLWQTGYQYEVYIMAGSSMDMYIRDYNDAAGTRHHQAIYSVNNGLEAIDMETGEKTCVLKKSSSITGLFVIKESPLVYTFERSGAFTIQDVEAGREYTDNAVNTDLVIVEAKNGKGTIGIMGYQSPELVILRYCEGIGIEKVETFEDDVVAARYTPDGKQMAVQIGRGQDLVIKVMNSDDHSVLGEFAPGDYVEAWDMDEQGRVYVFSKGVLYRYDPAKNETVTAQSAKEYNDYSDYIIDLKAHKAIGYRNSLIVIDTDSMQTICETDSYEAGVKLAAVGGKNGDQVLLVQAEGKASVLDVSDPDKLSEKELDVSDLNIYQGVDMENGMDLSSDGRLAVFNCTDSFARVYDIEKGKVTDEIPFDGRFRSFLKFSPDDTVLMMQGDDYYFRAYDLNAHKVKAYAYDQYYEINDVSYEAGKVELVSASHLYILNEDTYDLTAAIDGGRAVSFAQDEVIVGRYEDLYRFPYQDLKELEQTAYEQLNGEVLSEEKRLQLNMD